MSKNEYLNKKRKKDLNNEEKEKKENKEEKNKKIIKENIIIGIIKVEKNILKERIINSYENFKNKNRFFYEDEDEGIENIIITSF